MLRAADGPTAVREAGMNDERDDETKAAGPDPVSPAASPTSPASPIDELRTKVTDAASDFLKARLGLEEGVDGALHFPDRGMFENIGQRADQFVRGFFRGFVEKTPEEREVVAGERDPKDVPSGTEVATRLLAKVSETMSGTFHEYLAENAVDPTHPETPVVVDGRFLLRHGAPLLASFVQALGSRFSEAGTAREPLMPTPEQAEEAAHHEAEEHKPHVDYRVDLPSVFKSLFVRPPSDQGEQQ